MSGLPSAERESNYSPRLWKARGVKVAEVHKPGKFPFDQH